MDDKDLDNFLQKYITNQYTEAEHNRFIAWLQTAPIDRVEAVVAKYGLYFKNLPAENRDQYPELVEKIEARLDIAGKHGGLLPTANLSKYKRLISVAAAIILISSVCVYFFNVPVKQQVITAVKPKFHRIIPGTNKAILTLSNGRQIILDSSGNGIIAQQYNTVIKKTQSGQLIYDRRNDLTSGRNNALAYNTITTPRGGQYQVILPDGTKVWLNAASSLNYPTVFNGTERNVVLTGEAYFEVAKNKKMPFKVTVNNMQVEVLGTHFNIMGYTDETSTRTTLLEGSVKVTKGNESKIIIPGQQANVKEKIQLANVDANQAIEWKNGNFNFSNDNLKTIMRKIARWYDVTIEYQGDITKEGFVGVIPRSENISEVLNMLELTGLVHFKIQERRIIVMN